MAQAFAAPAPPRVTIPAGAYSMYFDSLKAFEEVRVQLLAR